MNTDKTGGPAFPVPPNDSKVTWPTGMTLWDWYAGQFASGCSAYSSEVAARFAADFADAMLAERKKRGIV